MVKYRHIVDENGFAEIKQGGRYDEDGPRPREHEARPGGRCVKGFFGKEGGYGRPPQPPLKCEEPYHKRKVHMPDKGYLYVAGAREKLLYKRSPCHGDEKGKYPGKD